MGGVEEQVGGEEGLVEVEGGEGVTAPRLVAVHIQVVALERGRVVGLGLRVNGVVMRLRRKVAQSTEERRFNKNDSVPCHAMPSRV